MPGRDGTGPFGDSTQGRFLGRCLNASTDLTGIGQGLFCKRGQRRNVMTAILQSDRKKQLENQLEMINKKLN